MSLEQDVAAARRAVDALETACGPLSRHVGSSAVRWDDGYDDGVAGSGRGVR